MYASNLERLLHSLFQKSDATAQSTTDIGLRFQKLRSFGRLPAGRENHSKLLTADEIAFAILGMATAYPLWAGHVSLVLGSLLPVGGVTASFRSASNLGSAVALILEEETARSSLVSIVVSCGEFGVNANGYGELRYLTEGGERCARFVPQLLVSALEPGAEIGFDPDELLGRTATQFRLNKRFFTDVARSIATCRASNQPPASDGSEYDAEERERRRLLDLGVKPGSNYLTLGVNNQVTWPKEERLVKFDKFELVLMPKTKDHMPSVSIDLAANRITAKEARTIVNRLMSVFTWCDDQFAVVHDGSSGSPIPGAVPRLDLAFTTTSHWLFDRKIPVAEDARRALALYREAKNAEHNYLVSYAVLNFYKILELRFPEGKDTRAWIAKEFPSVQSLIRAEVLQSFDAERGTTAPDRHIYDAYRIAVAHASPKTVSDPDEADEQARLYVAAEILQTLARHFIVTELAVSASAYSGT